MTTTTLYGTVNADVINAGSASSSFVIYGYAGDDHLYGGGLASASDTLYGGDGDDVVNAGINGNDTLWGEDGNDTLIGGWSFSNDTLYGGVGADNLTGNGGNDILFANAPAHTGLVSSNPYIWSLDQPNETDSNTLNGGADNDILVGGYGNDTLYDGLGIDTLIGGEGNDTIALTGGSDHIYTGGGSDTIDLSALEGNGKADNVVIHDFSIVSDTLLLASGITFTLVDGVDNTVRVATAGVDRYTFLNVSVTDLATVLVPFSPWGGTDYNPTAPSPEADDVVTMPTPSVGATYIYGTSGKDYLDYSSATTDYVIDGVTGPDTITGGSGNDIITSSGGTALSGYDILSGGAGNDYIQITTSSSSIPGILDGGDGNDIIVGGNSIYADVLTGGKGDDYLTGRGGGDTLTGGDGKDVMYGGAGQDYLIGEAGTDTLYGNDGDDRLYANMSDLVAVPTETSTNVLDGGAGNDIMYGGYGKDTLTGGAGNDQLFGEEGNDTLQTKGGGFDDLFGGKGNDKFDFTTLRNNGSRDHIVVEDLFFYNDADSLAFGSSDVISSVVAVGSSVTVELSTTDGMDDIDFVSNTLAQVRAASTLVDAWCKAHP